MAKYEWSEVFMSIEGEAKYSGHPTVYVRFAKCNFQCRGFNNPTNRDTTAIDMLGFDPAKFDNIYSIPLITRGCDSIYSWDTKFEHMWKKGDEVNLTDEVLKVLPYNTFTNPGSKQRIILSLTGGEPTLRLKFWIPLLDLLYEYGMRHILVETNCAVPLKNTHVDALYDWKSAKDIHAAGYPIKITWSNSPKLSISGEKHEEAIRPEIAVAQMTWKQMPITYDVEQYFKFVCGPDEKDFDEVSSVMQEYYAGGVDPQVPVYIMPEACTEEQQQSISAKVAHMCMQRGFIYCHRIQNSVFGNGVGT
jgi:organic radical activating enzyme